MARYLCNGILTGFQINKDLSRGGKINVKEELENILNELSDVIDLSLYNLVDENEDSLLYAIKREVVDEKIYELIEEIDDLTPVNCYPFAEIAMIGNNAKEKFPLKCEVDEYDEKGLYYINFYGDKIKEEETEPLYWTLSDDRLRSGVSVYGWAIKLWHDHSKFGCEDETFMLMTMNNMKSKYYKSKLSGALIYYVD